MPLLNTPNDFLGQKYRGNMFAPMTDDPLASLPLPARIAQSLAGSNSGVEPVASKGLNILQMLGMGSPAGQALRIGLPVAQQFMQQRANNEAIRQQSMNQNRANFLNMLNPRANVQAPQAMPKSNALMSVVGGAQQALSAMDQIQKYQDDLADTKLSRREREASIKANEALAAQRLSGIDKARLGNFTKTIESYATVYGQTNPYADEATLNGVLSTQLKGLPENQQQLYRSIFLEKFNASAQEQREVVSGFLDDAVKLGLDTNYELAMGTLQAKLSNVGIEMSPAIGEQVGDVLARTEGVYDLSAENKQRLGKILSLEQETQQIVNLIDTKPEMFQQFGYWQEKGLRVQRALEGDDEALDGDTIEALTRLGLVSDSILRLQSGAAANEPEMKLYFQQLVGGLQSSPEGLRRRLVLLNENFANKRKNIFNVAAGARGINF